MPYSERFLDRLNHSASLLRPSYAYASAHVGAIVRSKFYVRAALSSETTCHQQRLHGSRDRPSWAFNGHTVQPKAAGYLKPRGRHLKILCNAMGAEADVKLVIFTTLGCNYCRNTKSQLSKAGIKFQEFDLSGRLNVLKKAKEITGLSSVPQVFVNGDLLGGSTETLDLLESGKLQDLLKDSKGEALPKELRDIVQTTESSTQGWQGSLLPEGLDMSGYMKLHQAVKQMQGGDAALTPGSVSVRRQDAVKWFMTHDIAGTAQSAENKIDQMVELGFAVQSSSEKESDKEGKEWLYWIPDKPQRKGAALNMQSKWGKKPRAASEVAEGLRQIILELYDRHLSDDGKSVHYNALAEDPVFHLFVRASSELQAIDITPLSREERIAFFLNTYNVIIVHALTLLGPAKNFFERLGWFSSIKYNIGGLDYSADDMEHGILRGNSPTAASLSVLVGHPEWSKGYFKKDDPRLKQAVKDMDKRIHFALNCGAKSCPPIKLFSPDTLEEGLQSAATAFLQGDVCVDIDKNTVWASKIFSWYSKDFGSQDDLLHWLVDYVSKDNAVALERLLKSKTPIKLKFNDYDWGQNAA